MDGQGEGERRRHSSHWGAFSGSWSAGELIVEPHPNDPEPSPILQNFPAALRHRARVLRPMVRRGWLERGPGPDDERGRDSYVAMAWPEVLDRLAGELIRIRETRGPEGVFGGSYGWSSAGRFHHAQSQVHRFLNCALGGYVRSVNSYSAGASKVLLPRVLGPFDEVCRRNVTWEQIIDHTEVVLAFGGMAMKNLAVASGGVSRHVERGAMARARAGGTRFVLVGPLRDDLPDEAKPEWIAVRPGTDTALMLGLAHTLASEGLHDAAFLDRFCTGYGKFERYLLGHGDGQAKDATWAAGITGIPAEQIAALARSLAGRRTLITVAQSLQRSRYGEQPIWMALVLAAMLGQIGLPGGGYAYALGSMAHYGKRQNAVAMPTLPQGRNGVKAFIPCARIADMLLHPGEPYDYDGQRLSYPDVKLVYWAGGNPFHHHQDLNRLRRAFRRVDTLVVHEIAWTATARHADIVLPTTMSLEREDIGASATDPLMIAMHRLAAPHGEARDDYDIFADLSARLGAAEAFTEGRDAFAWLRHLYDRTRAALALQGRPCEDFETFWRNGEATVPSAPDDGGIVRAFREAPEKNPLPTPSGKVEITSATIAGFGYADCPGHPVWLAPDERPDARLPLQLVANQPATRLHSQFDFGGYSAASKRRGREVVRINPADAATRGISDEDAVRIFNDRGACLAVAALSVDVRPGVVQLPTGAWYDPVDPAAANPLCVHGNPNVLTRDVGTSSLAQGCTGQLTVVQVERFTEELPPIRAYDPPG